MKAAIVILVLVLAAIAYFFFMQPPAGQRPTELLLECDLDLDLEPLCGFKWELSGDLKVDYPRISLRAILESKTRESSVGMDMVSDGKSVYIYGTFTPISSPHDLRWYDVTDVHIPCIENLFNQIDIFMSEGPSNGMYKAHGITCSQVDSILAGRFSMPDEDEVSSVPAGGPKEYYR